MLSPLYSQALIIAFTSEFVPSVVYILVESPDGTPNGILNSSLSLFAIADLEPNTAPLSTNYPNLTHCYYYDQREPPGAPNQYAYTSFHTKVMMFRFLFVVVWENLVSLITIIIKWFLGTMPTGLRERIEREEYITNEIIVERERKRDMCTRGHTHHDERW